MFPPRSILLGFGTLIWAHFAAGQTVVNSTFVDAGTGMFVYSNPNNWSPAEVPNNTATRHYNVSISSPFQVIGDTDATVSNLMLGGVINIYNKNLVVTDTTAIDPTQPFATVAISAVNAVASFNAGALNAFSGGTLRGYYLLSGEAYTATLQFNGANIRALGDNSSLFLLGPFVRVIDENGNDAFGNLSRVESSAHLNLGGSNRATSVPLTNLGEIALGDYPVATIFEAAAGLQNFDPATRTISGGIFRVGFRDHDGQTSALTELRFPGADIVNNGSNIHVDGPLSRIADLTGSDGLRNLAHNLASASLTFEGHDFTTVGSFANDGTLTLVGSHFTVTGDLANFDSTTRTLTGGGYSLVSGAVLRFPGADIVHNAASIFLAMSQITDLDGNNALRNFNDNLRSGVFTVDEGQLFVSPGNFTNAGQITTIHFQPTEINGHSGELRVPAGSTYTQTDGVTENDGIFTAENIDISGGLLAGSGAIKGNLTVSKGTVFPGGTIDGNLTVGAQAHVHLTIAPYSPLEGWSDITGAASLDGILEVAIASEISLTRENVIPLLEHAGSMKGTFSNAPDGTRITTVDGTGSFVVRYEPNKITLTDFQALPPAQLINISARAFLSANINDSLGYRTVLIGGFIISGTAEKEVVLRGLGPSLASFGLSQVASDPVIELHGSNGSLMASNDDWKQSQADAITASGLAPKDDREAALRITLSPGTYTIVLREKNGGAGNAIVEIYDLSQNTTSKLANISGRGYSSSETPLIAGIIAANGQANAELVIRAIGPDLHQSGIFYALDDPTLEVHNANGDVIAFNDNWGTISDEILPTGLAPSNSVDSALRLSLPAGSYTAIVRGARTSSGVAVVEVYDLRR